MTRMDAGQRQRTTGILFALAAPLLLGACVTVGGPRPAVRFAAEKAEPVFTTGFESIADRYVKPVTIGTLVMDGLDGLAAVDSEISVSRVGDVVELWGETGVLGNFEAPNDTDADGWARLTVRILKSGAALSPGLRKASLERVYKAVFDGALADLDPYSRYAGVDRARRNRAMREGFGGIGIRFKLKSGELRISKVVRDTPASRAGIKAGDRITRIDDEPVAGLDRRKVLARLRGRVESRIAVTVLPKGKAKARRLNLARALIIPHTITARREGDLAYFRISSFNQRTAADLSHEILRLKEESKISGMILDLRGNPGGLLDQAVTVADLFLDKGRIVSTRGRHPNSNQAFDATAGDIAEGLPLAILINGESASAAEIVSAALQDQGRAVVIGSDSFGKGTVQNVIRLPNNGELTLTWSRFHAPSGYAIQGLGVMPTVCTSTADATEPTLVARIRKDAAQTATRLAQWRAANLYDEKEHTELRRACPPRRDMPETDLEMAHRLLSDPVLYARALRPPFPAVAVR